MKKAIIFLDSVQINEIQIENVITDVILVNVIMLSNYSNYSTVHLLQWFSSQECV